MRRSGISIFYGLAGVAALCLVVGAMAWLAGVARHVSARVAAEIRPPGPPVTRANLPRIMGKVPLAPFLALDESATNDPRTRIQAVFAMGRGKGQWVLVFVSGKTFDETVAWYDAHLPGWQSFEARRRRPNRRAYRDRAHRDPAPPSAAWFRGLDYVGLVQSPNSPNRLLMFLPSRSSARGFIQRGGRGARGGKF